MGPFAGYRRISSDKKWLRVHDTNEWYDYYSPENVEDLRRFFDHYLKTLTTDGSKHLKYTCLYLILEVKIL